MGFFTGLVSLICATLAIAGCGGGEDSDSDDGQVTAALDALAVATDGVENTDRLIDDAEQLAQGKPLDSPGLNISPPELSPEVPAPIAGDLDDVAEEQAKTAALLEDTSAELDESESVLAKADDESAVNKLKQTRQRLASLRNRVAELEAQLLRQIEKLKAAIEKIRDLLRESDALESDDEQTAARAISRLQQGSKQVQGIGKALVGQVKTRITDLTTREDELSGPPPVTGPADCGINSSGAQVVVNTGTITCEEAMAVIETSADPQGGNRPPQGWTCSTEPITLDGTALPAGSGGLACTSDQGIKISAYNPDSVPIPSEESDVPDTQAECEAQGGFWLEGLEVCETV